MISKKIDSGKIIDVKRFNIKSNDNVDTLLEKTYKIQTLQFKEILKKIRKHLKSHLNFKTISSNEKWSKKLYTKKDLEDFYILNKTFNIKEKDFKKYLKSTITKNFSPYLKLENKKFSIFKK